MEARILRPARPAAPRALLAVCLAALALSGCGGEPGPRDDADREPWPLQLETPGVIGYAAVALPPEALPALDALFGGRLEGLAARRHLVALHLDTRVFGGPLALALPLDDEAAFRASFERAAFTAPLGGDRYRLLLPRDHVLAQLFRGVGVASAMFSGAQLPSLEHLTGDGSLDLPVRLRIESGRALLAPSLEGAVVTSRVLDEVAADSVGDDGPALVLALDVERFVDTYHDLIQQGINTLRGALLGARVAGFAGLLGSAMSGAGERGGGSPLDALPFPPETLWALLEVPAPQRLLAVGLRLERFAAPADPESLSPAELARLPSMAGAELLFSYAPGSPEQRLIAALRPAPALPAANFVAHMDAGSVGAALGDWLRPLAVLIKGDGAEGAAWQAQLAELLTPWDGRVVAGALLDGDLFWLLGTHPNADWDLPAIDAWVRPLAEAFALELPPHDAWHTGASAARVGDFSVLSPSAPDDARLDAFLRDVAAADWSGEDVSQPALRVDSDLKSRDGSGAVPLHLGLGRDARTGLLGVRFAAPESR